MDEDKVLYLKQGREGAFILFGITSIIMGILSFILGFSLSFIYLPVGLYLFLFYIFPFTYILMIDLGVIIYKIIRN